MDEVITKKRSLIKWFSDNPWVGLIGVLLTFGFGIFAIYTYVVSIEKPELTYMEHPVKTAMVNKDATSRISVYYDGKPVNRNVSIAQIEIWNAGKQSIWQKDVLNRTKICYKDSTRILEATLLKTNRPETCVVLDTLSINKGIVFIDWKILEKNDGAILQLIYEGDIEKDVIVTASIEGQKKIAKVKTSSDRVSYNNYLSITVFLLTLCVYIILIGFQIRVLIKDKPYGWYRVFLIVNSLFLILVFISVFLFNGNTLSYSAPPIRF
ncbi:MAG: hypothetical protein M0P99_01815 [Candidatus Cloacimonetes bacterium]|nr:hypothetical protein [Candidatus Cloacimonadota bacterium]